MLLNIQKNLSVDPWDMVEKAVELIKPDIMCDNF
jgi:hypothetical protein